MVPDPLDMAQLRSVVVADPQHAVQLLNAALPLASSLQESAALLSLKCSALSNLRLLALAIQAGQAAVKTARDTADQALLSECLQSLAFALAVDGRCVEAAELCHEALSLSVQQADTLHTSKVLGVMSMLADQMGWHERGYQTMRVALLAAQHAHRQSGQSIHQATSLALHAHNLCATCVGWFLDQTNRGQVSAARAVLQRLHDDLNLAQQLATQTASTALLESLGNIRLLWRWYAGQWQATEPAENAPLRPGFNTSVRCLALGLAAAAAGRDERAVACLSMALESASGVDRAERETASLALAAAQRRLGQWQAAYLTLKALQSSQRHADAEQRQQKVQSLFDRLLRARTLGLSFLTHDIRTPLAAIKTLSRDALERPAARTPELATEMLKLTQMGLACTVGLQHEADLDQLQRDGMQAVVLKDTVADAVTAALLAHSARRPQVRLLGSAQMTVLSHAPTLQRLLLNLLDNAVAASPQPALIDISCERQGHEAVLTIRDHGPGLPPHRLLNIVEGSGRTAAAPGYGLGLRYVTKAVTVLGGALFATNAPDGGAVFHIALPIAPATATTTTHPLAPVLDWSPATSPP